MVAGKTVCKTHDETPLSWESQIYNQLYSEATKSEDDDS